jgi:serine phosphatase RsbU (regulator of sigma subunit)
LKNLTQKIDLFYDNYNKAFKNYLISHDRYRYEIYLNEKRQYQLAYNLRKQVFESMQRFEAELFKKIKKVVDYYMLKQKFLILKQIEKYKNQMQQAVLE